MIGLLPLPSERKQSNRTKEIESGFVLAEVLVVSVIVAILAAVAIPVYTGYVTQQRKEVVKSIAETAAVSANIWYRKNGSAPPDSSKLGLFLTNSSKFRLQIVDPYIKVQDVSVTPNVRDSALFR